MYVHKCPPIQKSSPVSTRSFESSPFPKPQQRFQCSKKHNIRSSLDKNTRIQRLLCEPRQTNQMYFTNKNRKFLISCNDNHKVKKQQKSKAFLKSHSTTSSVLNSISNHLLAEHNQVSQLGCQLNWSQFVHFI